MSIIESYDEQGEPDEDPLERFTREIRRIEGCNATLTNYLLGGNKPGFVETERDRMLDLQTGITCVEDHVLVDPIAIKFEELFDNPAFFDRVTAISRDINSMLYHFEVAVGMIYEPGMYEYKARKVGKISGDEVRRWEADITSVTEKGLRRIVFPMRNMAKDFEVASKLASSEYAFAFHLEARRFNEAARGCFKKLDSFNRLTRELFSEYKPVF